MDFDQYDFFNAPQYIDFNEFVKNDGIDDDDVDQYFETHREEDDFLIPSENTPAPLNCATNKPDQYETSSNATAVSPKPKSASKPRTSVKVAECNSKYEESEEIENQHPAQVPLPRKSPTIQVVEPLITQMVKMSLSPNEPKEQSSTNTTKTVECMSTQKPAEINAEPAIVYKPSPLKEPNTKPESTPIQVQVQNAPVADTVHMNDDTVSVDNEKNNINPEETEEFIGRLKQQLQQQKDQSYNHDRAEEEKAEAVEIKHEENELHNDVDREPKTQQEEKVVENENPNKNTAIKDTVAPQSAAKRKVGRSSIPSLNQKIMKGPAITFAKKITISKVTVPQPFHFSTTTARLRKAPEPEKDTYSGFKAKPVPMKVLKGDVFKVEKPTVKTTQPQEIHFASDDRIRERNMRKLASVSAPQPEENVCRSRARSICARAQRTPSRENIATDGKTSSTQSLIPNSATKRSASKTRERSRSSSRDRVVKPIHLQPFSFEERDKEMLRKKEEKIRKALQQEQTIKPFHAQPLPDFASAMKKLPKKRSLPPTQPEPFKLKCDQRGMNYQEELKRQLEEDVRRLKQEAEFVAQALPISHVKPFHPEKSAAPLAEPMDIHLNTDRRAQTREKFHQVIKEKEAELEEMRQREKVLKEEQEKKMTQVLRQLMVHKAKPVPKSRVFEVAKSDQPLTNPISPAFELLPSQRHPRASDNNSKDRISHH